MGGGILVNRCHFAGQLTARVTQNRFRGTPVCLCTNWFRNETNYSKRIQFGKKQNSYIQSEPILFTGVWTVQMACLAGWLGVRDVPSCKVGKWNFRCWKSIGQDFSFHCRVFLFPWKLYKNFIDECAGVENSDEILTCEGNFFRLGTFENTESIVLNQCISKNGKMAPQKLILVEKWLCRKVNSC